METIKDRVREREGCTDAARGFLGSTAALCDTDGGYASYVCPRWWVSYVCPNPQNAHQKGTVNYGPGGNDVSV